jgi:hypothetical protein
VRRRTKHQSHSPKPAVIVPSHPSAMHSGMSSSLAELRELSVSVHALVVPRPGIHLMIEGTDS